MENFFIFERGSWTGSITKPLNIEEFWRFSARHVIEQWFSNFFKSDPIFFFLNWRDPYTVYIYIYIYIYIERERERDKERKKEGKTTALQTDLESHRRAPEGCSVQNQITVGASEITVVRVLAFMHIYSDICFVQSIVMIITMSLQFRENMRMSLQKVCCKYKLYIGPLSSMNNETFIHILNGEYTAKKARKVRFLKKLSLISVNRNL